MRYFKKMAGQRLYLSPVNPDDAEIYTKWLNDYGVSGNLGNYHQLISLTSERKALEQMADEGQHYAIVLNDGDILIGNISFVELDLKNRRGIAGLFIGEPENRGKGHGAEAFRLLLDYGFKTLGLHNVGLYVHSDNENAIACYKKVGFREYGRGRESFFKNGKFIDIVCMDILDSEFYAK